jgi:hypothetical protein
MEGVHIPLELEHLIMGMGLLLGESVCLYKSTNLTIDMTHCVSKNPVVGVIWNNRTHKGSFCSLAVFLGRLLDTLHTLEET